MSTIQHRTTDSRRRPSVVFVPIEVAWAFTAARGWHVLENPTSAIDMDRLVEQHGEAEAREQLSRIDTAKRCAGCGDPWTDDGGDLECERCLEGERQQLDERRARLDTLAGAKVAR